MIGSQSQHPLIAKITDEVNVFNTALDKKGNT